ncbi:hypothetical protein RvY_13835 [Ramazzottius varieornatus]|uniref:Inositol polyphosphate-related phosphatase domain-containing protein n=1 Tax=Ramazzottius varieornatus TaxID=947166 RepID=A0A1D1VPA1_RAMVA|nr:hypothetical protein RvY_13835 [Ramazzottius varieornatus]
MWLRKVSSCRPFCITHRNYMSASHLQDTAFLRSMPTEQARRNSSSNLKLLPAQGSFTKEFPELPILEFDSRGDEISADVPKLRIRTCTWNLAGKSPRDDFTHLLGIHPPVKVATPVVKEFADSLSENLYGQGEAPAVHAEAEEADVLAIGFQELSSNPVAPVMETVVMSEIWTSTLRKILSSRDYVLLQTIRLQGILLLCFCKSQHLRHVRNLDTSYLRLGASGWWGNKGAVGISFDVRGVSVCFVNSHLSPHDHAFEERVRNYRQVLADLSFSSVRTDVSTILEHDYAFWLGDFNFRIEGISQDKTLHYIEALKWPKLLKHDQLRRAAHMSGAFSTFKEGKIEFPPTYKFVQGTDTYDMRNPAKIRRPSYCDRILWRTRNASKKAQLIEYRSHMEYNISDHKPVTAVFEIALGSDKEQFVVFDPIDRWYIGENGYFRYSAKPGLYYSSWDWIGLFKTTYTSFSDYVTWLWTPGGKADNLGCINGRYITKTGRFLLIYFSSEHRCGVGFSDPFEITSV